MGSTTVRNPGSDFCLKNTHSVKRKMNNLGTFYYRMCQIPTTRNYKDGVGDGEIEIQNTVNDCNHGWNTVNSSH